MVTSFSVVPVPASAGTSGVARARPVRQCFVALLVFLAQSASAETEPSPDFLIVEFDQFCPPAYRLMTLSGAERNQSEVCGALQDWAIARLAGSASIGGSARNCELYRTDHRTLGLSVCVPLRDYGLLRGALLNGGFRSQSELNTMSGEDWREALIVELANRTADTRAELDGLNNQNLSGLGALVAHILREKQITPSELAHMTAADIRQTVISDLNAQTGQPIGVLSRMTDLELVDLINRG